MNLNQGLHAARFMIRTNPDEGYQSCCMDEDPVRCTLGDGPPSRYADAQCKNGLWVITPKGQTSSHHLNL
jgi:hypothetical protein